MYIAFHPNEEASALQKLEHCINDLRKWMNKNRLKLNDNKTEFIIFGSKSKLGKINTRSINVGKEKIIAVKEVRNIGAYFDSELKMQTQIQNMCKSAWLNLFNISKIRKFLIEDQTKIIVQAYVTSKLDANNSLLSGIHTDFRAQLQRVQNAAAKLIKQKKKYDHVTPLLHQLHWLPIEDRINFKILLLVFKSLNEAGPVYLRDLLEYYRPPARLRSADDPLILDIPHTKLRTYGDRAFSVIAAILWNKLPLDIRGAKTMTIFKSKLKTKLFKDRYN